MYRDDTMNNMSEVLDELNRRISRMQSQISNPQIIGQYPTTGVVVKDLMIGTVPMGVNSYASVVNTVQVVPGGDDSSAWVDISWTPPDTGVISYYELLVARKLTSTTYDNNVTYDTQGPSLSVRITNLRPNTTYGLKIIGVSPDSTRGDTYPDSVNYLDFVSGKDTSAPSAVSGFQINPSVSSLVASWNDNTDYDVALGKGQYEVQVDTTNTFTSSGLRDQKVSGTIVGFLGLTPGTTYYVRVRAVDSSGNLGPWTSVLNTAPGSATTTTDGVVPPAVATPAVYGLIQQLFAKWTAVSNPDLVTYDVYVGTNSSFTPSSSTFAGSTLSTSMVIKDVNGSVLLPGTNYYVRVVSRDGDGSAAPSGASAGTQTAVATSADIAANAIIAGKIATGTITAGDGVIGSLDAGVITVGQMSGQRIMTNSLDAATIKASTINADLLISARLKTADTGNRVELSSLGILAFDALGNPTFTASAADGSVLMSGTLQVPSTNLFATNLYPGQTTINQDGISLSERATVNLTESYGPDFVAGYPGNGQYLAPNTSATGGTQKFSYMGQSTAALAYNASYASVASALNGLAIATSLGLTFVVSDYPNYNGSGTTPGNGSTGKGYFITISNNRRNLYVKQDLSALTPTAGSSNVQAIVVNNDIVGQLNSAFMGADPVETTQASTVVQDAVRPTAATLMRMFESKGVRYGNTSSAAGRIRLPVSYNFGPNKTYVLSLHIAADAGNAATYLNCAAVKVYQRSYDNSTTTTLSTGIDGVITNISPYQQLTGAQSGGDAPARQGPRLLRYSPKTQFNLPIGTLFLSTGGNFDSLNSDLAYRRIFITFTTTTVNEGDHIMLELPTAIDYLGNPAGYYFLNGMQLEEAASSAAPTTYIEQNSGTAYLNSTTRPKTGAVAFPTFADNVMLGRNVIERIKTARVSTGFNETTDLVQDSVGVVRHYGNLDAAFPHGNWEYFAESSAYYGSGRSPRDINKRSYRTNILTGTASLGNPAGGFDLPPFRYRTAGEFCYLDGISTATTASATNYFGQVTAELCPDYRIVCCAMSGSNASRIDVLTSGEILLATNYDGGAQDVFLSNVQWPVATLLSSSAWTYVGSANGPAFQNSWVNFSATAGPNSYCPARYVMDGAGFVHLGGVVKNGAVNTIFNLPVGFRPTNNQIFMVVANGKAARITVNSNGAVNLSAYVSGGTNALVSLEGISFMAAGTYSTAYGAVTDQHWVKAIARSYTNSWTDFAAGYNSFMYYRDHYGRCHLAGTVAGGTIGSAITRALPKYMQPSYATVFPCMSGGNAVGRVQVGSDGTVLPQTGTSNSYWALDGITYFADA